LLFYASITNEISERILGLVEESVPKVNIEVFRTIAGLSARFHQLRDDAFVAVLLTESRKELMDFLSLSNLFRDIRIILIVPHQDEDPIALGHRLKPNFLCYKYSDFTEIVAVVNKILHGYKQSWEREDCIQSSSTDMQLAEREGAYLFEKLII